MSIGDPACSRRAEYGKLELGRIVLDCTVASSEEQYRWYWDRWGLAACLLLQTYGRRG